MRKLIYVIMLLVAMCLSQQVQAQNYERKGKTFEQVKTERSQPGIKTDFTWKDSKGVDYPIYITANGSCYVLKVSRNGNEYRKYLGEQISREVCAELGIEYTYKPKQKKQ
jgi:hypothetical protein